MKRKASKGKKARTGRGKARGSDNAIRIASNPPIFMVGHGAPLSIRQSVTIPSELAKQIERGKQQDESFSKSLLRYVRQGLAEEARAKERLREVVRKIQAAGSEEAADAYVDELTEALFGPQREPRA